MARVSHADDEENPFKLPPDDKIFEMRQKERERRQEERERVKQLRVWEKTTASSRVHRNRRVFDDMDGDEEIAAAVEAKGSLRSARTESVGRDPRREKENVTDFVQKKRDMFLLQMLLDVKKAEILKLDEKAKQKDEALKKSQAMLDEDVTRFDQFLQNNDQKAHRAMKEAEDKTKKKQDRMQKIKQLKSTYSAIQSEIAKHKEQKEECSNYKKFLVKLTPQEWKDKEEREKVDRKDRRKREFVQSRSAMISSQMESEIQGKTREMEEKAQEAAKSSRRRTKREGEEEARQREADLEKLRRGIQRKFKAEQDKVDAEYEEVSSGEEMPLYFQKSEQLLNVFTSLEEKNLFLIQNSQETEQTLDEISQRLQEAKRQGEIKRCKAKRQIEYLEKQIEDEKIKCDQLSQKISSKGGASEQNTLLDELRTQVEEVHMACDISKDHAPDTLQMLSSIEAKLEDHLRELDEAEEDGREKMLKSLESGKERERRDRVRTAKVKATEQKNEERLNASLLRSQAPIYQKVGKQIMFRSAPLFQARRVVEEDDGYEEAVKEFQIFDIWINKDGIPDAKPPVKPS